MVLLGLPEEMWIKILHLSNEPNTDNLLYVLLILGHREQIDMCNLVKSHFYKRLSSNHVFKISFKLYNKLNTKNMSINIFEYMRFYSQIHNQQIYNRFGYLNNIKYIQFMYNLFPKNNILGRRIFYNILLNKYMHINSTFITNSEKDKYLDISERDKLIVRLLVNY